MSTYFDFSTYVYSNLLNSKNVSQQFATAIANCAAKFYCGSLDPISRAGTILKIPKLLITIIIGPIYNTSKLIILKHCQLKLMLD